MLISSIWELAMYLDEVQHEIYQQYKNALIHIGVDLSREDVRLAIESCVDGLEDAFKALISYWYYKKQKIEFPSAFLIDALANQWKPLDWNPDWMDNPKFISPAQAWLNSVKDTDLNPLILEITDKGDGFYVIFTNGKSLYLSTTKRLDWQKLLEFAQSPRGEHFEIL